MSIKSKKVNIFQIHCFYPKLILLKNKDKVNNQCIKDHEKFTDGVTKHVYWSCWGPKENIIKNNM